MSKLLEVNKLCASYGATQVLYDVDFSLKAGHITAILGANGAGNRPRCVRCARSSSQRQHPVRRPAAGGQIHRGRGAHGRGRLPDGRGTFTGLCLSVEENLRLGAYVRGNKGEMLQDMERMFTRFPILKQRRHQQAGTLSGGEQQMLAISRALMLRPKLLLLDEPSFGLAPLIVAEIFRIMRTINKEDGVSMLLVERMLPSALDLADHAYLLETGRVALSGPSVSIKKINLESVRRAYLGY